MATSDPRYVVEQGTDSSWLVVDRGVDRRGRRAIHRAQDERAARSEAETLSGMEAAVDALPEPEPDPDFDAMFAAALGAGATIDETHNFDHLLQSRPGQR
uniref:hypothetical protein n=1 Tax=Amycolatopsis sp. CA-293810 TaxID=3239926 RepID=UPI003F491247